MKRVSFGRLYPDRASPFQTENSEIERRWITEKLLSKTPRGDWKRYTKFLRAAEVLDCRLVRSSQPAEVR
ncbi:hypothetical protein CHISP_3422 [Chitinispirillum alkaliphilum]|nr:hypothetical protein CHISP_3422 [Chitinispirillum alkaliphilum]